MFRGWTVDVKPFIKRTNNVLLIKFASAQNKVDSIAKARLPLVLPDNNRVYVRKAQFQFGWDWGPKFVGCGIWKKVNLKASDRSYSSNYDPVKIVTLIQQKDSIGTSFYFKKNGKPIYIKGANWIPGDIFLPRLTKADYRRMLLSAKDANMNMLRVWGGGVYESDDFYDLCDSLDIMVWQDFMFAGGMYPCDDAFMNNVREEVKYQIERLRNHPCIVLWCGNNEVEEAWKNWGWQGQFNLHGADSAKVWNDYKRLFQDSLKKWVDEFDGTRPYVSTSPKNGWGRKESFTEGDSHYWGVWWGLQDWEAFENKTGRFVSEYGMQAMPNWNTIKSFTDSSDRYMQSPVIQSHQKASDGFKKLNHYLTRYFIDSARLSKLSLEDYTYLSQCMQYYILKNSIAVQRSKYPANMGTLLWQLNDCWPVTSWSITDYSRQPKAAWYAVMEAYRDDRVLVKDSVYPKYLKLSKPAFTFKKWDDGYFSITSNVDAHYVYLNPGNEILSISENYFSLKAGVEKELKFKDKYFDMTMVSKIKIRSLYDILNAQ
jgi:beta-mannosidase